MAVTVSEITGFHIISASLFHVILSLMEKFPCIQCTLISKAALLRKDDWRDLTVKATSEI